MRRVFHKHHKIIALLGVSLVIATLVFSQFPTVFADGGSFGVSNPGNKNIGDSFSVTFKINPSVPIDTVDAYIYYSANTLSLQGISCSSSFFTYSPSCNANGNPAHVTNSNLGSSTTSSQTFATLTFKTTASGNANIAVSGNVDYHGTYTGSSAKSPTPASASFAVATPAAAPTPTCPAGYSGSYPHCVAPAPAAPTPTKSSGNTGSAGQASSGGSSAAKTTTPTTAITNTQNAQTTNTTPAATSTQTQPTTTQETNITIEDKKIAFTNAALVVTTKVPTQVSVKYGLSKDDLTNTTAADALGTSHAVNLDPKVLIPGQTYYYSVVTKDAQGNASETKVASFTTKGLTVSVGVFDANHQPIKRKQVTLHSNPTTAMTDDKGYAIFSNVIPGDHRVLYSDNNQSYSQAIVVANNVVSNGTEQSAPTQNFSVIYKVAQQGGKTSFMVPISFGLVAVIGAVVFLVLRKRFTPLAADAPAPATTLTTLDTLTPVEPEVPAVVKVIQEVPEIPDTAAVEVPTPPPVPIDETTTALPPAPATPEPATSTPATTFMVSDTPLQVIHTPQPGTIVAPKVTTDDTSSVSPTGI